MAVRMKTAPFLLLVASGPALLVGELSAKLTERLFFPRGLLYLMVGRPLGRPLRLVVHEPQATNHEPLGTV